MRVNCRRVLGRAGTAGYHDRGGGGGQRSEGGRAAVAVRRPCCSRVTSDAAGTPQRRAAAVISRARAAAATVRTGWYSDVDRVRAAGQLVPEQLGPGVVEHGVDVGQAGAELLGHDHRQRGRDALADLGAGHARARPGSAAVTSRRSR